MVEEKVAADISVEIGRSHRITNSVTMFLALCGVITALFPISAILINVFEKEVLVSMHIYSAVSIILCVALIMSVQSFHRRKVIRLLESIDIAWDEEEPLDLEWIVDLIESNQGGTLAKEIDEETGAAMYITRGVDEKGPDWGRSDSEMSESMRRRDAIKEGRKYDGMEGELTKGEKTIEEADKLVAEDSQKRWEKSEANDSELIEAGVGRLGDLVKEGHFERTAKEGAMSELVETDGDE